MNNKKQTIWEIRENDQDTVDSLAASLHLPEPVARLLVNRGIVDINSAAEHLEGKLSSMPDPFLLKGMDGAVKRIEKAMRRGDTIVAWGDYDVDGITSLSLLVHFFESISFPIRFEIPRRMEDGYGLKPHLVEKLAREGVNLIITVDNGITSVEEVDRANELGVDVIIVDHHELDATLPKACAIVDPKQTDCNFPYDDLAAVGLTFMLLVGLRRHLVTCGLYSKEYMPNLKDMLDIVALGTIADMVPLLGLNRLLVRHGLPVLSRSIRPGVLALKEVSKMDIDANVDSFNVGFMLAPRINAGGRMGDALAGVQLLTTNQLEVARKQAYLLNHRNNSRRKIEEEVVNEALAIIENDSEKANAPILIVAKKGWHEGVIGLAASKLVDKYNKPAIVIAINDEQSGRGSCRSIKALHIQETLSRHKEFLDHFGGHSQAAGMTIPADKIEEFITAVCDDLSERLTAEDYIPRLITDGELCINDLNYELLDQFEQAAPFGIGNSAPLFIERDVKVVTARKLQDKHWKLGLSAGKRVYDAIIFNRGDLKIKKNDRLDIAYVPEYNNFRGNRSIQLRLRDIIVK